MRTSQKPSDYTGKSEEYQGQPCPWGMGCHQTKGLGTQRIASQRKPPIPSPSSPAGPQGSCWAVATLHRPQQPVVLTTHKEKRAAGGQYFNEIA